MRHLVRIIRLAAALAAVTLAAGAATASAVKVSDDKGGWFWRAGTSNDKYEELDPIDLVWDAGAITSTMSEDHVKNVIEANWNASSPGGPPPSKHKMTFGQLCMRFGRQIAFFRDERPVGDGVTDPRADSEEKNQYAGSTSSRCFSQYHMRFWNDHTIARNVPDYGSQDQMAISGVHHDTSTGQACTLFNGRRYCVGAGHKISAKWDAYRNYAVHRGMRFLCGRSHWRRRPGADHDWQGGRFDGWIAIIKYTYDGPSDNNCENGLK
jgi:hypothetical protein